MSRAVAASPGLTNQNTAVPIGSDCSRSFRGRDFRKPALAAPCFAAVNQRFSFLAIRDTRDYFAGQAIVGMLSNPHCTLPVTQRDCFPAHTLQILAFHAYQIADALIEASVIKLSSIPPEP